MVATAGKLGDVFGVSAIFTAVSIAIFHSTAANGMGALLFFIRHLGTSMKN